MTRHAYSCMLVLFAIVMLAACVPAIVPATPAPSTTRLPDHLTPTPTALPKPTQTPIAAPRVRERSPNFKWLSQRRLAISLTFDREMDQASVAAALTVEPSIHFSLRWEAATVYLDLAEPLAPGGNYRFTLARTAADREGVPLAEDYQWEYRLSDLIFSHSGPTTSQPASPLVISFRYSVDAASAAQALTIRPAITGTVSWDAHATKLTFTPAISFTANTMYTVAFDGRLLDSFGDELPAPPSFAFTTPPPILAVSPNGDHANPAAAIRVTFDRLMDRAATEAAFKIVPETAGRFEWKETTLTFKPESSYLDEVTAYTVTIGAGARAVDGAPLLTQDYVWSFRTDVFQDVATFGVGPNAQVVEAGGRRAVQFVVFQRDASLVTFELYRLSLEQFLDRYSSDFRGVAGYEKNPISTNGTTLAANWQAEISNAVQNYRGDALMETTIPADVAPGAYILNLSAGHVNDQLIVLLTHNAITVKQAEGQLVAWVTGLEGERKANVEVGVYARDGVLISGGQADAGGIYRAEVHRDPQPLIVVAREGDDLTAAGLSNEWISPAGYWNNWWRPAPQTLRHAVYIYTDRPIYRPGQTVYFKAIIRNDDDALLSLPPVGTTVAVRLRDARDNVVRTIYLQTSEFGAVSSLFRIAEGAMLGNYRIEVTVDGEGYRQVFKVQDYRKPDYQIMVTADAASYVAGDVIRVNVDAGYFFGEPVPNANLVVKRYELGQNYCWEGECDEDYIWYDVYAQEINGKTDASGQFSFSVPAELGNYGREVYWWSTLRQSTWGIEVTVDDGSHQTVSGFVVVKVFTAAEKIQVDTDGYLKTPGEAFDVTASAATISGGPVSRRNLRLQLRQWNASTGDYTTVTQSVELTTDDNGLARAPITVADPGYYQVHLTGLDRRGNETTYDSWLYVFSEAARWGGGSGSGLKIAADRDTYAPGDTATLLVESNFGGPALLTFQRMTVRREQLVNLTPPLTRVEVPIQPDDSPNVFVAVSAWQPQDTTLKQETYVSLADAQLRTASVKLSVPVTDKTLTITLTPDKDIYAPREDATFRARVTNARGEPVSAEVSLALVDEAIFSLSDELSGPIFDAFYHERDSRVSTFDSMALERWLNQYGCECGGGGGGNGGTPGNPRNNFPDTAAWFPEIHTDANGEAVVTFTLPDNLTSWRLTAKAVTADTQVGETFVNIVTKQDIIVRPLLPRTLTAGDQVELSTIVHNYGEARRDIVVGVETGPRDRPLLQITGEITQTITLDPGERRVVGWTATALEAGEASVVVWADPLPNPSPSGNSSMREGQGGGGGDAVQLTIPIQPLAVPDVETKVGEFTGEFTTVVVEPAEALGISTVKIELSRSIAGTLLTGLEYLTGFPYGCVEQTMSRALPNAVVGRAFHQLGVGNPTLQADLPPKINASLQRLYGYQHDDGGWGWWFDDATDAYQTAWVVFGLSVTKEAGYEVDESVIQRGVDWQAEALGQMDERTRAFALYSMSVAGRGDLGATQLLAASPDRLDTFSQAALALALHNLGAADDAEAMLDVLAKTAVVADGKVYWPNAAEDGHYQAKTMSSTTRSTALALEAFVRISPDHELEPGIVRYLMGQRRQTGWGSTNETSFTLLALTDHLLAKETATTNTEYSVELGGQVIASGTLGRDEPAVSLEIPASQLQSGANTLRLRQNGAGQLYYVISSRMYVAQSEIEAAGKVLVSRVYLDAKTGRPISGAVTPGQLVKVELTVTMPDGGFYVIIEDKLPGGLEALNEGLNTASHEGQIYDYSEDYSHWQDYGYNNKEVHGDRVSFFITELSAGRRTFTYYARATRAGSFVALPAEAYAMYDLTVWGRSASGELVVEEER